MFNFNKKDKTGNYLLVAAYVVWGFIFVLFISNCLELINYKH